MLNKQISMKKFLLPLFLVAGLTTLAQKKNETSAAVEIKSNFKPAFASGDIAKAEKHLLLAKTFIDQAATNAETEKSPKTLYLKGEIYGYLYLLSKQTSNSAILDQSATALQTSCAAYKSGLDVSDKFDEDIKEGILQKHDILDQLAGDYYNKTDFNSAAIEFKNEGDLFAVIGIYDTTSYFNSALCYEKANNLELAAKGYAELGYKGHKSETMLLNASNCYRILGNDKEALSILSNGVAKNPKSVNLLIDYVNLKIDLQDTVGIGAIVSDVQNKIAKEPKNRDLHFILARIYMGQKKNEQAVTEFDKTLEIDPTYEFAHYFLGFNLYFMVEDLDKEKAALKPKDPKMFPIIEKMDNYSYKAIGSLEQYILKNPNDKNALTVLSKLYAKISDKGKADEYMQRANAIK